MKTIHEFDPLELVEEQSLLAIWKKYRKNFPESSANRLMYGVSSLLAFIVVLVTKQSTAEIADQMRKLLELGMSFSISLLGFLLAGFTIFAMTSRASLFERMAVTTYETGELSFLKQNFFAFVQFFIVYLCFCAYCLAGMVITVKAGIVSTLLSGWLEYPGPTKELITKIGLWLTLTFFAYVFVQLKIFIFNIFHFTMTGIASDIAFKQNAEKSISHNLSHRKIDQIQGTPNLSPLKDPNSEQGLDKEKQ